MPPHHVRAQNKLIGTVTNQAIFDEDEPVEGRFSKLKMEDLQIPVAARKKKDFVIKPKQI
jgi:hypothetical protein